ncbi:hypothetical cytosolic protein [Streptococcus pyogenes MGAS2096]|nr:hypothetical cytosolic protein [Streptococcus pyogenes MGAS2096]
MTHNHENDHQHEVITLVDEQGNETLFEILLTIDGREEFGKNYVLLVQRDLKKMSLVKLKSKPIHLLKMKMVLKGIYNRFLRIQMLNGI